MALHTESGGQTLLIEHTQADRTHLRPPPAMMCIPDDAVHSQPETHDLVGCVIPENFMTQAQKYISYPGGSFAHLFTYWAPRANEGDTVAHLVMAELQKLGEDSIHLRLTRIPTIDSPATARIRIGTVHWPPKDATPQDSYTQPKTRLDTIGCQVSPSRRVMYLITS